MQKNPAIVRARLQQIQMELSKLALETTEPMAWQALHCANDSLGWAITAFGREVEVKLTKSEQAKEAAIRG